MVSIIFFLIVGLNKTIKKFERLTRTEIQKSVNEVKKDTLKITPKEIDSIKNDINNKINDAIIPIPKETKKKIFNQIEKQIDKELKDTISSTKNKTPRDGEINFNFGNDTRLDLFIDYIEENPEANIDEALELLKYEKNFLNRFLFTRAKIIYSISKEKETRNQWFNQLLSYGSVSLFLLLPFFTIFLKLFYIRRSFTYVDHLIFVFHIQTVFFMLFSIYFLFLTFDVSPKFWVFLSLFALYLFLAMKNFYMQSFVKTFLKFIFINLSFIFVASIGIVVLLFVSFTFF